MPDNRGTVREIAWREVFPWLILVRSFRLAIQARMLLLASLALLLTVLGWWIIAWAFAGVDDPLASWLPAYASSPWAPITARPAVGESPPTPAGALSPTHPVWSQGPPNLGRYPSDAFLSPWRELKAPVQQLFSRELTYVGLAFLLVCMLWAVAVWGFFAGAITRIAAMQLGREEAVGLNAALRFAWSKWRSYFAAPLFPLLGVLLFTIPMALLGLVMRFDVGVFLAALLWPLMLLASLVMAILLLGLLFGWPLMWPAISTEATDSFGALSGSYAYVYHRPLHYLFYAAVVILLGTLGWLLVANFAELVAYLPAWAASWGSGNPRMTGVLTGVGTAAPPESGVGWWGGYLINFWSGCVRLIAFGFVYSYFWTASTAIYLLLRRDEDGTEMDEVYVEGEQEAHGLPPLATDAAGVPVVSPIEAAAAAPATEIGSGEDGSPRPLETAVPETQPEAVPTPQPTSAEASEPSGPEPPTHPPAADEPR